MPPCELHKQECLRCLHPRLHDAVLIVFREKSGDIIYDDGALQEDVLYLKFKVSRLKKRVDL